MYIYLYFFRSCSFFEFLSFIRLKIKKFNQKHLTKKKTVIITTVTIEILVQSIVTNDDESHQIKFYI